MGDEGDSGFSNDKEKLATSERQRRFNSSTDALQVVEGIDLSGKTILITGSNSGIGIETSRTLALKGAHVVMANRNMEQSAKVRDNILQEKPDAKVDLIELDLSSLQLVQQAAKEFLSKNWPLHVLILNAGVFAPVARTTVDGYETAFGVNHLGHFYLTYLLLEKLRQCEPSRIVVVSSLSHNHTGKSGKYFDNCWDDEKSLAKNLAHDEVLQDALWDHSLKLIQKFERRQKSELG